MTLSETAFRIVILSLPFPLLPRYLEKLLMFEHWKNGSAVKVNEYDAAALVVPEPVGVALVAVVDALSLNGLRRTPHFRG